MNPDRYVRRQAWDDLRRPVWVFDPHRLCGLYANAAALILWDAASLEDLLARDFSQVSEAVRARVARLAAATAGGEAIGERWTFYPNGRPVTVQATISTCRFDGRDALLFEASSAEVEAEERRAVEALRHTSTMITLFDRGGEHVFSNPAAYRAYGVEGLPFRSRFPEPGDAAPLIARAGSGEVVVEVREMRTGDGVRWHHLDVREALDPVTGEPSVLVNERDVTERVRAEQARAAAEQKAAMAEARRRFLTDMSHELRTPLNAVIGFSDLLGRSPLGPEQGEQVARINESGRLLLDTVNAMIRLSEDQDGSAGTGHPPALASADDAEAVVSGEDSAQARADIDLPPLRVLYVDDNAHNRALVSAILATRGIECTTADDGDDGLALARGGAWDLILMDIQMPRMDGVASTRAIRALPTPVSGIPILAVTANTLPDQLQGYADAGMNDCIPKPIDVATLLDYVAHWSEPQVAPVA